MFFDRGDQLVGWGVRKASRGLSNIPSDSVCFVDTACLFSGGQVHSILLCVNVEQSEHSTTKDVNTVAHYHSGGSWIHVISESECTRRGIHREIQYDPCRYIAGI